ncbi:hypothetical protein BGX28_005353, partial [Mortierella sp. GBA30]
MGVRGLPSKFKDAKGTEAPDMRGKTTHVDAAGTFYYLVQPRAYSIFAANIQRNARKDMLPSSRKQHKAAAEPLSSTVSHDVSDLLKSRLDSQDPAELIEVFLKDGKVTDAAPGIRESE